MKNPRDNIKYDIPKEWVENFKKGCCPVCGKTKFEFDKRMKVYCSVKCKDEYSKRIYTWQELKDRILRIKGKICVKCGKTQKQLTEEKTDYKNKSRQDFIKAHPEVLEIKRKELMEQAEKYYKEAQNLTWESISLWQWDGAEKELPYQYDSFEVDHKIAVMNGGEFWDENNLQVLCYTCHKEKTKIDFKERKNETI